MLKITEQYFVFTDTYDEANTKLDFLRDLSEIDTDDSLNREKLKNSRHSRHAKTNIDFVSHSTSYEGPKVDFTPRSTIKKRKLIG